MSVSEHVLESCAKVELTEQTDQDRIELRRLERGRISVRLHGQAIVFAEKLWAAGFSMRRVAE
jgi:hypothetical protein